VTHCRNQTALDEGGSLVVMSWHIHYMTNATDMFRFRREFKAHFADLFPPTIFNSTNLPRYPSFNPNPSSPSWQTDRTLCPFGPNFGSNSYKYVCDQFAFADNVPHEDSTIAQLGDNPLPFNGTEAAFHIPLEYIAVVWRWAKANQQYVDLLKHPNTGCMADDHAVRGEWRLGKQSDITPTVDVQLLACNSPGTGCNDYNNFMCRCMDRKSDPDSASCPGCIAVEPEGANAPTAPGYVAKDMPLVPHCNTPSLGVLGVDYEQIEYYSGKVNCGNLLLSTDLGSAAPVVTFSAAEPGLYYTLLILDTDANLAGNGSWPVVLHPGSDAPIRLWALGNIDAAGLVSGDLSAADVISDFIGPSPSQGSHRFGYYLFKQPTCERIIFDPLDPVPAFWDYGSWVVNHTLGFPVAANWHVTQFMQPRSTALNE